MYRLMRMNMADCHVIALNAFNTIDEALRAAEDRNRCPRVYGRYFVAHQDELPLYYRNNNDYLLES